MVAPAVLAAFFVGLLAAITLVFFHDRRAIAREAAWWEELKVQALDGYGRVFDWERDL